MTKKEIAKIVEKDGQSLAIAGAKLRDVTQEETFAAAMFALVEHQKRLAEKYQELLTAYLTGDDPEEKEGE